MHPLPLRTGGIAARGLCGEQVPESVEVVALFLERARLQRSGQGSGRPRGRQACHSAHKLLLRRLAEDAGGSGDRAAFPDMTTTLEHLIGEGDMVAVRHVWRGTHQGPYEGIAPTGRPVTFTGADIYRIVDGKIVEEWSEYDELGILRQLGAVVDGA